MTRTSRRSRRAAALASAATALVAATAGPAAAAPATRAVAAPAATASGLPPITHVWNIVLENQDYASTFGNPSADPYLAQTLPAMGALVPNYYGVGHESNDNYLAMVSGQPPNPETQLDCQVYSDFLTLGALNGIQTGAGCVYPDTIANIGNQLTRKGLTWKAYEQDMGNDPNRETAACGHPSINSIDGTQKAVAGDGYAARHDPFVYFHSVIDYPTYCDAHVVAMGAPDGTMPAAALAGETGLATDLQRASTTPAYSFITPNLCADGHDYPCVNTTGGTSALDDIDSFLSTWVPKIMASPAYKRGGLIEITFDESDGPQSDSSACCGEGPTVASLLPGITGLGGGKVGAVLLSPYIKGGTTTAAAYNHYSTLATDEKIFGLPRLGEAASVTSTFGPDVFTNAR
ncbi:alkaline phosphatase family protein [Acidiferrimicrobium sp. IK]|uniref:alkaline phosphatase family protein n=1 Tax=Acidiferrimicrobium sp. IK TaxID=2871700 RepID=UPI0021CB161A|nr:alkaline phosphatase family protein [Acidiferrimicrobium sp. IK]MCU4187310.1 alkaline phosphatase family protein [Acidiferrimicrobium sp. IK]